MRLAKCELKEGCAQKTRDVIGIQLPLPSAWAVAGALGHIFYQLLNCATALIFLKDNCTSEAESPWFCPMRQERVARTSFP